MSQEFVNLEKFGLSDEELFSHVDHSALESEKITAPRYSYWRSVFRVFFRKKINIVILCVLAIVLCFAYVYPALIDYDPFANLMDAQAKHLRPAAAFAKYGPSIHYILGTGASGEPTFDAVWNGARISLSVGVITVLIRYFGGYPEGVTYAILLMNLCAWAIDKGFHRRQFGVSKEDIAAEKAAKKAGKKAAKEAAK